MTFFDYTYIYEINSKFMKGTNLGEFEELVLLTVGILFDNAYSVAIQKELNKQTSRKISISAVHSAVYRLEEKGYLDSRMGEQTNERGGKRKRIFTISKSGKTALDTANELRNNLRSQIPQIALDHLK
jgi:PadR family transcriptional regulator PadR